MGPPHLAEEEGGSGRRIKEDWNPEDIKGLAGH